MKEEDSSYSLTLGKESEGTLGSTRTTKWRIKWKRNKEEHQREKEDRKGKGRQGGERERREGKAAGLGRVLWYRRTTKESDRRNCDDVKKERSRCHVAT